VQGRPFTPSVPNAIPLRLEVRQRLSAPLVADLEHWLHSQRPLQNTGVPTLGKAKTERLPIPLPPLAEQHRIVARVDALMALCDQLESSLATATTTRSCLLEALLHEALEPAGNALEAVE